LCISKVKGKRQRKEIERKKKFKCIESIFCLSTDDITFKEKRLPLPFMSEGSGQTGTFIFSFFDKLTFDLLISRRILYFTLEVVFNCFGISALLKTTFLSGTYFLLRNIKFICPFVLQEGPSL